METFLICIDGASPDLVEGWIEEGRLPNLGRIAERGLSGKLKSTFPPLTGPAWSSFQTGVNPGKHGVFNWLDLNDSYEGKVVNSNSIKVRTVWEQISSRGGKVGLVSLPVTYPPSEINGFVVPGFLTPEDSGRKSYPDSVSEFLSSHVPGFEYCLDDYAGGSKRKWIDYLKRSVASRGKAARLLYENRLSSGPDGPPSVLGVHFFATDLVQHYLWGKGSGDWDPRLEVFESVDREVGKLMKAAPEDSVFIVASDHGFGGIERTFNVNNWLMDKGFLKLKDSYKTKLKALLSRFGFNQKNLAPIGESLYRPAKKLGMVSDNMIRLGTHPLLKTFFLSGQDVDWDNTLAYSRSDLGHIRINLAGRERKGAVKEEKYGPLVERIMDELERVTLPGSEKKLASWVKPKEDLYSGPYLDSAPDILFNSLENETLGFGAAMFLSSRKFHSPLKPGNHRREGIIMASGPPVGSGEVHASIIDLAPTLLNLYSHPLPERMDGDVIEKIAPGEVSYGNYGDFYKEAPGGTDSREVRKKLESLGYL